MPTRVKHTLASWAAHRRALLVLAACCAIVLVQGRSAGQASFDATDVDYVGIIARLQEDVDARPDWYQAHLDLGFAYLALDALDAADNAFDYAVRYGPGERVTHYFLGRTYLLERQHAKAARVFELAAGLFPDWAQAYAQLGVAHFHLHNYVLAEQSLTTAIALMTLAPGSQPEIGLPPILRREGQASRFAPLPLGEVGSFLGRIAFVRGRIDDAIELYENAIALDEPLPGTQFQLGVIYTQRKQYEKAETAFRQALHADPQMASAHYQLGLMYARLGQRDRAAAELDTFRDLEAQLVLEREAQRAIRGSRKGVALSNLGWEYVRAGKYEEALGHFERAIWHDDTIAEAHSGLGFTLVMQDRVEEADAAFEAALNRNTELASTHYGVGLVSVKRAQASGDRSHYEAAVQAFRTAVNVEPSAVDAWVNLGTVLAELSMDDEALAAFERVVAIDPERHPVRIRIARTCLRLGRVDDAREHLDELLRRDPRSGDAYFLLGMMSLSTKDFELAASRLKLAAEFMPDRGDAWFHLGSATKALNDFERSQAAFRRAIELMPTSPGAHEQLAHLYGTRRTHLSDAVRLALTATDLDPQSQSALNTLSWIYYLIEDYANAEAAILRALELSPDNATYHEGLRAIRQASRASEDD